MNRRVFRNMRHLLPLLVGLFAGAGCFHEQTKPGTPAVTGTGTGTTSQPAPKPSMEDAPFSTFLANLRDSVRNRDVQKLARLMTDDFGYRWDAVPEGETPFAYWDQNDLWGELETLLAQPFSPMDAFRVSPPEFARDPAHWRGYRVGVTQVRGVWRFAYFVPAPQL